jgi:hypothetical protein
LRLFCIKHKRIVNAYPKSLYDKKYKGNNLISKTNNCNCEFTREYANKYRIFNKLTYYLRDGTEIKRINPNTQITYEIERK